MNPEIGDTEIGKRLGQIIIELVDLIADVDGLTREQVLEELFTAWWQTRITENR